MLKHIKPAAIRVGVAATRVAVAEIKAQAKLQSYIVSLCLRCLSFKKYLIKS